MIVIGRTIGRLMIHAFLLLSLMPLLWAEDLGRQNELIERMINIVLENNPTLKSQERLVQESQGLPEPRSTFAISGISFNVGAGVWNLETKSFGFVPTVTMCLSFSLRDPVRLLSSFNLKKEKVDAKQDCYKIKNLIISGLLARVREILSLESQRENYEDLKVYLEVYCDLIKNQVKAGVIKPDKLWDLKERIMSVEIELQDVKNQLNNKCSKQRWGWEGMRGGSFSSFSGNRVRRFECKTILP